ncbi:hypothetical protein Pcinc_011520 [Petrolisthes cinctipes]|uniref:Uncharacterized protein n=1 Tax=Petrolisthes cinctipes TaxID=88211 RepID=A0AAE1KTF0_PETCI|nr:hypothetical protein Pcinc_011520 [Petrolisthes cinctipes]
MDINGASIDFEATLDRTTCRFQATRLEVVDIGRISVDISGLGALDWIFEIVVNLVVVVLNGFIEDTVETVVYNLLNQVLSGMDLGPLGPIIGCVNEPPFMKQPRVHY